MLSVVKRYPVFTALCVASVFGVLTFVAAVMAKLVPLDLSVTEDRVVLIWNGVHLGVAYLVTGVLFQYSREAVRAGNSCLKKLKASP